MNGRISTGVKRLDDCLGGGIERGIITEIYGEAGSGKTNFCLNLAIRNSQFGNVLYIDTEGVSGERVSQISGNSETISNIKFFRVRSYDEQLEAVPKVINVAPALENVIALIFDTVTAHYRVERDRRAELRKRYGNTLTYQIEMLNNLAINMDIPVIMVNQVYTEKNSTDVMPVGGSALSHMAKAIFMIQKVGQNRRDLVVIKHRSLPEHKKCAFIITGTGIE